MRIMLSMLVLFLMMLAVPRVDAQTAHAAPDATVDHAGTFHLAAANGALVDRHDGTFVLIFEDAPATIPYESTSDGFTCQLPDANLTTAALEVDTIDFTRGWRADPDLTGNGILTIGTGADALTLAVRLRTPILNAETGMLSYTIYVTEVLSPANASADGLTTSRFADVSLQMLADSNFLTQIESGYTVAAERQRECACPPGTPGLLCEMCQSGLP